MSYAELLTFQKGLSIVQI